MYIARLCDIIFHIAVNTTRFRYMYILCAFSIKLIVMYVSKSVITYNHGTLVNDK